MGVLSWLKKPNASTAELAEQITAAEAELVRAQTAKDDAQEAFTLEGTDAAVRKLVKAEEELVIAGKYLARSKELHSQALVRDENARIAELEANLAAAEKAITDTIQKDDPLIEEEARLILKLCAIREQRIRVCDEMKELFPAATSAYYKLHRNTSYSPALKFGTKPSFRDVEQAVMSIAEKEGRSINPRVLHYAMPKTECYERGESPYSYFCRHSLQTVHVNQ